MDEQLAYSKLLHHTGNGLALKKPVQDVDVGDLCYWADGVATRILNVFDNKEWLERNGWPKLGVTKEQAVMDIGTVNLQVLNSEGVWWGVQPTYSAPPSFDIVFQKQTSDTAVLIPSSPCAVQGLRTAPPLQQWWSLSKRNAFRTWSYLLNGTGIFLVTKTVKAQRYASSLAKGSAAGETRIRVNGVVSVPVTTQQFALPAHGTQWVPIRNDMAFEMNDCAGKGGFTIFIEREASRMFALTDIALKEAAAGLWTKSCNPTPAPPVLPPLGLGFPPAGSTLPLPGAPINNTGLPPWVEPLPPNQDPFSPALSAYWLGATWPATQQTTGPFAQNLSTSSSPHWSTLFGSAPALEKPATWGSQEKKPAFDGKDRVTLGDGWYLIRGEDCFFLELAGSGLDLSADKITVQNLLKVLNGSTSPSSWDVQPSAPTIPQGSTPVTMPSMPSINVGGSTPLQMPPASAFGGINLGTPISMGGIPTINPVRPLTAPLPTLPSTFPSGTPLPLPNGTSISLPAGSSFSLPAGMPLPTGFTSLPNITMPGGNAITSISPIATSTTGPTATNAQPLPLPSMPSMPSSGPGVMAHPNFGKYDVPWGWNG